MPSNHKLLYNLNHIFSQFPSTCSSSRKCLLQWVTWYLSWTSSWLASETVSPSGPSKSNDQIWQINPMAGRYAGRAGQFIGLCARVFGSFINEFMSSNKGKIFAHWSSTKNTSSTFRFTQLRFQFFAIIFEVFMQIENLIFHKDSLNSGKFQNFYFQAWIVIFKDRS